MSQLLSIGQRFEKEDRWLIFAVTFVFAVLGLQYGFKASEDRSAIVRWRVPLQEIGQGVNIYERHLHPNTPTMALLLRPLALMPALPSALIWFSAKAVFAILAIYWTFQMIEGAGDHFPCWARLLAIALSIRPIAGDLSHGNVNLLILFLVVGGLYAFTLKRDFIAGLLLALAIACKVTPALFIPYFVWKRCWKVLAGCAVGLLVFVVAFPAIVCGWDFGMELLLSWFRQMAEPYLLEGRVFYSEHNNQSLPGLLVRLLTHSPSFSKYIGSEYRPLEYHNVLSLEPTMVGWISKAFMAIFAGLVIWVCRTPNEPRRHCSWVAEFSLVVLGMLLFSERTWKHHCVTLLLPFSVLAHGLCHYWFDRNLRRLLLGCLILSTALIASTSTSLMGHAVGKLSQVYGAYVWAFVVLIAGLYVLLKAGQGRGHVAVGLMQETNEAPR
ncbi:MAG: hypothetical protein KatS3mg105_0027 [Gemmatales bacterium]|nr:MAG: hypothetical protein KatS3mg105_0027 [Gemmatales bacterium]